jgi:CO dehydrogenase maturation factor
MSDNKHNEFTGRKIGLFGKGGAGKSTTVVLVARALTRAGHVVCIVDADSTNVGLHQGLGIDRPPSPLIDYFGGTIFSGGSVTCPVDDPTPLDAGEISLNSLPHDYFAEVESRMYLLSAGKLAGLGAGAGCDGPISKIARDITVRQDGEFVVTLVDFKAGFEDSARGVVTGMDWALVVVDPTQASLTLATDMKKMVDGIRGGQLPATKHLDSPHAVALANRLFKNSRLRGALFLLNKVADEKVECFLTRQLATHGIEPIGTIYDDPSIGEAWLTGSAITCANGFSDIEAIARRLETAVGQSGTPV